DFNLPRLVLINKLDRENADFEGTLAQLLEHFGTKVVPVQLPIGKEDQYKGVVDLIEEKALLFSADGKKMEEQEIPEDLREKAEAMREKLIEAVAETEDELLLKYLEGEALEPEEIRKSLRRHQELRQRSAARFYQKLHAVAGRQRGDRRDSPGKRGEDDA
ncbi:MAG TPA: hypothetical protein PLZ49_04170, partial [Bacillota bacterium]|nr:hypothetical protein [Bacillota bacterium]